MSPARVIFLLGKKQELDERSAKMIASHIGRAIMGSAEDAESSDG